MNKKNEIMQAIKFTLFSMSAGVIEFVSFTILKLFFVELYWMPDIISLLLSIIWNFTLNRKFTFKSAANVPIAMAKILGFYIIFAPLAAFLGDLAAQSGINDFLIKGIKMLSNFVLEFLFCKFVVYRGQENTLEEKKK